MHFLESYPAGLWDRVAWVAKLMFAGRFVGWDVGDGNVRAVGPESRGLWVMERVMRSVVMVVVLDVVDLYMRYDPYFKGEGGIEDDLPKLFTNALENYHLGFLSSKWVRLAVVGMQVYLVLSLLWNAMAVVFVSLGGLGLGMGRVGEYWSETYNWLPLRVGFGIFCEQTFETVRFYSGYILSGILIIHRYS